MQEYTSEELRLMLIWANRGGKTAFSILELEEELLRRQPKFERIKDEQFL